jgi:hypothetical protein
MAVFISMARTKGEFKDLVLDNLFVITKNAAQLFDNVYRENTNALADDLGHTFDLLITRIDHKDAMSIPEPLWHAYMLLWQAANTLIAGYQSIRVGFPVEAVVIARPTEKYGFAGNDRKSCSYAIDPSAPMQRWKVAWESARRAAKVSCRFHDLRHTFISRLAESQASDSTVMALAGHVSRSMMERYSHIRMEAKRRAVDDLSGIEFEPGWAQNRAQFFISEKSDEANPLKTSGEPGRTRTCNPLIKSQLLYH